MGDGEDLDTIINSLRNQLAAISVKSLEYSEIRSFLGIYLFLRYNERGSWEDLEEAIVKLQKSIELVPKNSQDLPNFLTYLGIAFMERNNQTHSMKDLNRAIDNFTAAVNLEPLNSNNRLFLLINLRIALQTYYEKINSSKVLDKIIELSEEVVSLVPKDSPELPEFLTKLGLALQIRYDQTEVINDIDHAIDCFQKAVHLSTAESSDYAGFLTNLGIGFQKRAKESDSKKDIDSAINNFRNAVKLEPKNSPHYPQFLNNLGTGLMDRYEDTHNIVDLDECILCFEDSIKILPDDSPIKPVVLSNHGRGLLIRYDETKTFSDLMLGSTSLFIAHKAISKKSQFYPLIINNLGYAYQKLYASSGRINYLKKAIKYCQNAVRLDPKNSTFLSYEGLGLSMLYSYTHSLDDLNKAICSFQKSVEYSPQNPYFKANLGFELIKRYEWTESTTDLNAAIGLFQEAADKCPKDSMHRLNCLTGLWEGILLRYKWTGSISDLKEAFEVIKSSREDLDLSISSAPVHYTLEKQKRMNRLLASSVKVCLSLKENDHDPALSREYSRQAFIWAEGMKSKIISKILGRGEFQAPATIPASLIDKERLLLKSLNDFDLSDLSLLNQMQMLHNISKNVANRNHTEFEKSKIRDNISKELQDLWEKMEEFGPAAQEYVSLRQRGSIQWDLIVNITETLKEDTLVLSFFDLDDEGVLFVFKKGWIEPCIIKHSFNSREALERYNIEIHKFNPDLTELMEETWHVPFVEMLRKASVHLGSTKRILFVPHSYGHFIPWAAVAWKAGIKHPLTIIPALSMIPYLIRREKVDRGNVLIVGNSTDDLKYVSEEVSEIAEIYKTKPLVKTKVKKNNILKKIGNSRIIHIAAHGTFIEELPLESYIALPGGDVITVREIIQCHLQAELVVFSACETAREGNIGGNEVAGFSHALLTSGANNLILSLWKVDDLATSVLMREFYSNYEIEKKEISESLYDAMDTLQRSNPKWGHTYYWGSFILIGGL